MEKIVDTINNINKRAGMFAAWLTTILVVIICGDVFMRYFFSSSQAWILELEWHLFALIFLLGASYALNEDKHVRVDVFYDRFSDKKKAIVNLVGSLLLLLPWCYVIIWKSAIYASSSFAILEGSPQPNGLPARYLIKFAIVLAFVLLLLQGISVILQSIITLRTKK